MRFPMRFPPPFRPAFPADEEPTPTMLPTAGFVVRDVMTFPQGFRDESPSTTVRRWVRRRPAARPRRVDEDFDEAYVSEEDPLTDAEDDDTVDDATDLQLQVPPAVAPELPAAPASRLKPPAAPPAPAPPSRQLQLQAPGGGALAGGGGALLESSLVVNIAPGTGSGRRHALNKLYRQPPFPAARGARVTFDLTFRAGFEWGCRGKVGGFVVGTGPADGHEHSAGAASYRLCWNSGGGAFVYVYVPAGTQARQPPGPLRSTNSQGALLWEREFRTAFTTEKAHKVELALALNSPGAADGTMTVAIDGRRQSLGGVIWRTGNQPVSFWGLGVFHGGPCAATRPSALVIQNMRAVAL